MNCPNCDKELTLDKVNIDNSFYECLHFKCSLFHLYKGEVIYYSFRRDKDDREIYAGRGPLYMSHLGHDFTRIIIPDTNPTTILLEIPQFITITQDTNLQNLIPRLLNLKAFS